MSNASDIVALGEPVELFQFSQGGNSWFFTSHITDIFYNGQIWASTVALRGGRVKIEQDVNKSNLTVTFPRENAFAAQYISGVPEEVTLLTIYRGPYDPDSPGPFEVYWKGRVLNTVAKTHVIEVSAESVATELRRTGLRIAYSINCSAQLYDGRCGVNQEAHRVDSTVAGSTGATTLTCGAAGAYTAGYFKGGIIRAQSNALRFIVSHSGATIEISRGFGEDIDGQVVSLFPGCDHSWETCKTKFLNGVRFRGFPWVPETNPFFDGKIID